MFKSLFLSLAFICGAKSAYAFDLNLSAQMATDHIVEHHGDTSVVAYKVDKEDEGENFVTVKVAHSHIHFFDCHYHGINMVCHEDHDDDDHDHDHGDGHHHHHKYVLKRGHDHDNDHTGVSLATLRAGEAASLKSFGRRLDVESIVSYKVWSAVGHGHGHKNGHDDGDEETQVWVRYDYLVNESERIAYFMCHGHDGSSALFCHRENHGHDEPNL